MKGERTGKKMSINCLLFLALTCQLDSLWVFMSTKNFEKKKKVFAVFFPPSVE